MAGKQIYSALMSIQRDLKAPKNQYNSFGKYKYRSLEDIVEAVKPLLNENGLILNMTDDVVIVGDRIYIKATVSVIDVANGDTVATTAFAREAVTKKGSDDSQITGLASSYARKYALNGLFAIDDAKDADTNEYQQTQVNSNRAHEERNGAIKVLNDAIKKTGVKCAEVSAIAGAKFSKTSTKDMTVKEIYELADNLSKWIDELK